MVSAISVKRTEKLPQASTDEERREMKILLPGKISHEVMRAGCVPNGWQDVFGGWCCQNTIIPLLSLSADASSEAAS
jgi:hypothetical protein